ncbi:MAG: LVIVD repeat-containing protein [Haloarculaceae archaeon]
MHRRAFLRATAGVAGLGAAGRAGAHPTPTAGGGTQGTATATDTPAADGPLGSVSLPDAREAVVDPDGTTVYVATSAGFAVVDASDPSDPTVLTRRDDLLADRVGEPFRQVYDVKVDGDRLLAVGPAHGISDVRRAAVVLDVSDPASPEVVGVHDTEYPIHNAFLADGVAYLTGNFVEGNPLVTVDVTGDPEELGRWSLLDHDEAWEDVATSLRVLHDVYVQDGYAYLAHWDAGTWILDVSDPADPAVVSRVRGRPAGELAAFDTREERRREGTELPGNDHYVAVDDTGTLLGIGEEGWDADDDGAGGPGGIELYDVSDPTAPQRLAVVEPPPTDDPSYGGTWTTAHNFELTDGYLYSSWYQGGVRIHDVSDPTAPREVYAWRDSERTRFWTARLARPEEFFVAASMPDPGDEDDGGALYTFPDVERSTPTPTPEPTPPPERESSTAAEAGDPEAAGGVGPGLGPLAALAGLGGVTALLRRRKSD